MVIQKYKKRSNYILSPGGLFFEKPSEIKKEVISKQTKKLTIVLKKKLFKIFK